MNRFIAIFFFALVAFRLEAQPVNYTAKIYPKDVLVNDFQGWGVSLCWWANVVGGYSNRDDYAELVFNGLKLNIVRYNIGGGENPNGPGTIQYRAAVPGFETGRGVWNWDVDQNQRWMLKSALTRGVTRVAVFANSPPYWMTVSGSTTGAVGGTNNLKVASEQEFAEYLATVVQHLSKSDGVTFASITPVNEPSSYWWTYGGHQEGCHMSAAQQSRVIPLLRNELNKRGLDILIDAPEDNDELSGVNQLKLYTKPALTDVGQVSTHTYKANAPYALNSLATHLHKPLRQTEYGDGDVTGLVMARRIRDDLVQLRPISWCYWQGADYAGWGLLHNRLEENGSTDFWVTRKYYTFEQFTRFLRPGCNIIGCNDKNSVVGYDPTAGTLTIVTVNDTESDFNVTFDLRRFALIGARVERYRTSAAESLAQLAPLDIKNRRFVATVPAGSVMTFVLQNFTVK